ncbi:MAG: rhomboid family intramembrane serine protease [Parachlamydiales bacterium]|nr:rhomboid family intramembrane serine protease [Parachlamydiales bacterium]
MRQVGTLTHENHARRLTNFLTSQGIGNRCEVTFEPQNGHMAYQIWIQDEDRLDEAAAIFAEFERNPTDRKFDAPEPEPQEPVEQQEEEAALEEEKPTHRFKATVTHLFIALCVLVFFITGLQRVQQVDQGSTADIAPMQAAMLYDLPTGKTFWQGIYGYVVAKVKGENPTSVEGPLFVKIREGEIWRLFSPCILHKDLLHILFNMLWLWYLGRPIEQRIGPFRTLLFTLIVGISTNTLQYLMSGPYFIGYSGIVTGLAGFIWMRERIAPWEGYPLNRSTILFLLIFIFAILGLQIFSFFVETFTTYSFAPNIANTAHIAGAIIGAILGRFHYFAQRVKP